MAWELLNASSVRWTTQAPAIYMNFYVDHYRSGNSMYYRVKVEAKPVTSPSKYGYPIILDFTLNGYQDNNMKGIYVKSDFPVSWDTAQTYESGWYYITNATASSYPVSFRLYSSNGSLRDQTFSYSMPVDKAGANISGPSTAAIGNTVTLTLSDFDSGSCSCNVWAESGNYSWTIRNGVRNSFDWTIPEALAQAAPSSTSLTIRVYCYTYSDSTKEQVGSTTSFSMTITIPSTLKPSVTLTVTDPTGYKDEFGSFVQSLSKFRVVGAFTGNQGSTLSSYSLSITSMGNYTAQDITTGVIPVSGTITIKATVTDSRGNIGTATVTVTVMAYEAPKITAITVERSDASGNVMQDGTYGKVTFSAAVTSMGGKNTAAYAYCYRLKGGATWTETTLAALANQMTVTNQICIFPASIDYSYEVAIRITDKFVSTLSTSFPLSSAFILAQATADGTGLSLGCRATKSNTLELGMAAIFNEPVSGAAMGLSDLPIIPSGSDFNYQTTPGAYSCPYTNFVNAPVAATGTLIVSLATGYRSTTFVIFRQIFMPQDNARIYIRYLYQSNGSWTYGGWRYIATTAL